MFLFFFAILFVVAVKLFMIAIQKEMSRKQGAKSIRRLEQIGKRIIDK